MGDLVELFAGGTFVCIECGETWTTKPGLEEHWTAEGHGPDDVQQQRLDGARVNEGWLLRPEDG